MRGRGHYEEAKVIWLAALEGRRRGLGEEYKLNPDSLNVMGGVLNDLKDCKGALNYYQQALRGQERVLGKTQPYTLGTVMNMANTYMDGLKDYECKGRGDVQTCSGWLREDAGEASRVDEGMCQELGDRILLPLEVEG